MLIHLIADYGAGDLAFAEVCGRFSRLLPGSNVFPTPVPAFDTVSAGFCAAQLALGDAAGDGLIYMNVAARADHPDPRPGNLARMPSTRCSCVEAARRTASGLPALVLPSTSVHCDWSVHW